MRIIFLEKPNAFLSPTSVGKTVRHRFQSHIRWLPIDNLNYWYKCHFVFVNAVFSGLMNFGEFFTWWLVHKKCVGSHLELYRSYMFLVVWSVSRKFQQSIIAHQPNNKANNFFSRMKRKIKETSYVRSNVSIARIREHWSPI